MTVKPTKFFGLRPATTSRTSKALRWLNARPGRTVYAAAVLFAVNTSVLYRAIVAREGRPRCPACGQIVRRA